MILVKNNIIITEVGPIYLPFNAIWKSKEGHFPVEVVGYLGEINKRHYVSIKDSNTGIPLDEVIER